MQVLLDLVHALDHLAAVLRRGDLGIDEHARELVDLARARFELRLQLGHLLERGDLG